jgi:hypothetical protein
MRGWTLCIPCFMTYSRRKDSNFQGIFVGVKMDWTQAFAIIGVNIALIGIVCSLVVWAVNKLDADVKSIGNRLDGHAQRIDQLYRMFVDLLKEKKP